ncbi:hypothetical protein QE152_g3933 [Popillia japonica]|uniref:Uncharacterized protein n=1 Tax=Popillia japonica TaxID=7064 RepID=A0AAW1MYJ8_POPJA
MLDTISPINSVTKIQQARKNASTIATILNTQNNLKNKRRPKRKLRSFLTLKQTQTKKKIKKFSDSDSKSEQFPQLQDKDSDEENEFCSAGCGEEYQSTKETVDWIKIKCVNCNRWVHEDCTKYGDFCDSYGKLRFKSKKL